MATEKLGFALGVTGVSQAVANLNKFDKAVDKVAKSSGRVAKKGKAAGSVLQAVGRGAGDARYGFIGIANNIEQVIDLFGTAVKQEGSTKAVFKNIGKSILGAGGIVFALQIMIALGPEIYKFFKGAFSSDATKLIEENEKAVEGLNKQLGETKDFLQQIALLEKIDVLGLANLDAEISKFTDRAAKNKKKGVFFRNGTNLSDSDTEDLEELKNKRALIQASKEDLTVLSLKERTERAAAINRISSLRVGIALQEERGLNEFQVYQMQIEILDLENKYLAKGEEVNKNLEKREILLGKISAIPDRGKVESVNALGAPSGLKKLDTKGPSAEENPDIFVDSFNDEAYNRVIQNNQILSDSFNDLGATISGALSQSGKAFGIFAGAAAQGLAKYLSAKIAAEAKLSALRKAGATEAAIEAAAKTAAEIPLGAFILPALVGASLSVISSAFSGGGGGTGTSSTGQVSGRQGPRAVPVGSNNMNIHITGELRGDGQDIVTSLDTAAYNRESLNGV